MIVKIFYKPIKCNWINPGESLEKTCNPEKCTNCQTHSNHCQHAYIGSDSIIIKEAKTVIYNKPDDIDGRWSLAMDKMKINESTAILSKLVVNGETILQ